MSSGRATRTLYAGKLQISRAVSASTLATWAKQLGHTEALELFLATLKEEEATDEKLTKLAKSSVNLKAAA